MTDPSIPPGKEDPQAAFRLPSSTRGSFPTAAQAPSPHSGLPPQAPAPHTGPLPHCSRRHVHPTGEPFPVTAPGPRRCPRLCPRFPRPRPGSHRAAPVPAGVCRAWPRPRLLLAAFAPPLRRDHNSQRAARPRARRQPIQSASAAAASLYGLGGGAGGDVTRGAPHCGGAAVAGAAGRGRCGIPSSLRRFGGAGTRAGPWAPVWPQNRGSGILYRVQKQPLVPPAASLLSASKTPRVVTL